MRNDPFHTTLFHSYLFLFPLVRKHIKKPLHPQRGKEALNAVPLFRFTHFADNGATTRAPILSKTLLPLGVPANKGIGGGFEPEKAFSLRPFLSEGKTTLTYLVYGIYLTTVTVYTIFSKNPYLF